MHVKAFLLKNDLWIFPCTDEEGYYRKFISCWLNMQYEVIHLFFIMSAAVNYMTLKLYQFSRQLQEVWGFFFRICHFRKRSLLCKMFSIKINPAKINCGAGYAFLPDFYELKRHAHKYKLSSTSFFPLPLLPLPTRAAALLVCCAVSTVQPTEEITQQEGGV